jgi:hypothetical protein
MTLGNMRTNGVRSLERVLLAVPPPGDLERGPVARSRASSDVRAAHGVHPVRHHWCRRPAELVRAAGRS